MSHFLNILYLNFLNSKCEKCPVFSLENFAKFRFLQKKKKKKKNIDKIS